MAHTNRLDVSLYGFWLFALSVILLPIGLGGDRPIPLGLAQIGLTGSALSLALNEELLRQVPFFARLRWALGLIAAVLIWAFVQTQPFVPQSWAHPLWQDTATVLNRPVSASISIVPEDALKGLMRLLTYIAAGLLAYVFGQDVKRARQLVKAFWISGTVICIYGLVIQLTGAQQILWFDKWAYKDDLTATFVNRNHFAVYAGMVMTTGLALMMQSWRDTMRSCKPHKRIETMRNWVVAQGLWRTALLFLTFLCIALSHSRAGLAWSLAGVGSYLFLYQIYQRQWKRALAIALILIFVFAAILGVAVQVSDRFSTLFEDYSSQTRAQVYELTGRIIGDNPWLGYGLNGFEPEFRLYQRNMYETFNHVHSDVLESLLDLGIIAGLALWSAIALLLSGLWHGIRHRRQNGLFPTLGLAASIMILGHALVDFDLQIPGIALTWTALLGTGLAQSWPRSEKKHSELA